MPRDTGSTESELARGLGLLRSSKQPVNVARVEMGGGWCRCSDFSIEEVGDVVKGGEGPRGWIVTLLNEAKELAGKLGQLVSQLDLQYALEDLHVLFPLALTSCFFVPATTALLVTRTVYHAVGTHVVFLAIRAFAGWMG